jgi:hypothetical protein
MSTPPWDKQVSDWVSDLESDLAFTLDQAENGPYFPERDVTRESLLAYADTVRGQLANPEKSLKEALRGQAVFRVNWKLLM